jgi:hypothetical protein
MNRGWNELFELIKARKFDIAVTKIDNIGNIFVYACGTGNLLAAKWLYELNKSNLKKISLLQRVASVLPFYKPEQIDINKWDDIAFRLACLYGHKHVAEWLYSLSKEGGSKVNIHTRKDVVFKNACKYGDMDLAIWLYGLSKSDGNTPYDIHQKNERLFRMSCLYGHLEIAKWLYGEAEGAGSRIDIGANDNYAFFYACNLGRIDIARWLYDLSRSGFHKEIDIDNVYRGFGQYKPVKK